MSKIVSIDSLPEDMSMSEAVEIAYGKELQLVEEKLVRKLSVLVECDKQIIPYFYTLLKKRIKSLADRRREFIYIDAGQQGKVSKDMQIGPTSRISRMIHALENAVRESVTGDQIIVIPYLDVLSTTTKSGLTLDAREIVSIVYDNPTAVFLGFKDPAFEIPTVLANIFTFDVSMVGIARDILERLILKKEARKLHDKEFNPFILYKYVSGLNPVRLRQVMNQFHDRGDYTPENVGVREKILADIRKMTISMDFEMPKVDLDVDIGGYEKVKKRINEDILSILHHRDSLKNEESIREIESLLPRGIIFWGPPGTGKTFFAKAIAHAIEATVTVVNGPEIKSRWVGESEENIRRIFSRARENAPSVIIFDELDSIATTRGIYTGSGVEHSIVNQLLTEMDGFRSEELVFVVGTTNFVQSIDPALLRPGRFELQIEIPFPDENDRREILKIYREKLNIDLPDEVLDYIVRKTSGTVPGASSTKYTGDHLNAIARNLKRDEIRGGKKTLTVDDVSRALSRNVTVRPPANEKERRVIATHEAGHAIISVKLQSAAPLDRVVIDKPEIPELAATIHRDRENRYIMTKKELLIEICVCLGGKVAEKELIGETSCGDDSDLRKAYFIARLMVEDLGMVEGEFVIPPMSKIKPYSALSEKSKTEIDRCVREIIAKEEERAVKIIRENKDIMLKLIDRLVEKSELNVEEVEKIINKG